MKQVFISVSEDEFKAFIQNAVREELEKIKPKEEEQMVSPSVACTLFVPKISKSTLHLWQKAGRLTPHRIGGRVFYKKSEILSKLETLQRYSKTG